MFHTASLGGLNYTAPELALTDDMVKYWTNFAHTGNPNANLPNSGHPSKLLEWPQYRVDPSTGTKLSGCLKFRAPGTEVTSSVCVCTTVSLSIHSGCLRLHGRHLQVLGLYWL